MCCTELTPYFGSSTFQILFYALRPGFVKQQKPTVWLGINIAVQLLFNYALITAAGWTAWGYLIASSFFAGSLHPCAAHFIAEHYMFAGVGQETWSYYGPLNALAYNVSCHMQGTSCRKADTSHRSATTTSTTTFPRFPGRACRRCAPPRPSSTTCCRATRAGRS